jgi:hypothetical protein
MPDLGREWEAVESDIPISQGKEVKQVIVVDISFICGVS